MESVLRELVLRSIEKLKQVNGLNIREGLSIPLEKPKDRKFGDYSTNIAFSLMNENNLKAHQIAKLIENNLPPLPDTIQKIETVGGYLNFHLSEVYIQKVLAEIIRKGREFGNINIGEGRKIQIEFVSANPTGPLHIGHGRGGALGSSLANIMEKGGWQVQKEYYINDVGIQIETLGRSLSLRIKETFGEKITMPDNYYQGEYLSKMALENKDILKDKVEDYEYLSRFASNLILDEIKKDLKNFGVLHDSFIYESSFYEKGKVEKVIEMLKERGLLYTEEGALWLKSKRFSDEKDRVVIRKDGKPTYLASDIAYHQDKMERGFDTTIDIWGADHHGYILRLKAAMKGLGYNEERLRVILVQMVRLFRGGDAIQMSTRKGEFITLREVVNEVGKDAARFFFLLRRSDTHLDFDLELAKKESPENPVYYVQYAHARICSIFEKLQESPKKSSEKVKYDLLDDEKEISLMRKLEEFPSVVKMCAETLQPHHMTGYLYELASLFHHFYDHIRVLTEDEDLTFARLHLCFATKIVLSEGLRLLGVEAPHKM